MTGNQKIVNLHKEVQITFITDYIKESAGTFYTELLKNENKLLEH